VKTAASKHNIDMRIKIAVLILFASVGLVRADQNIESAQQALKDQGFYYGEITGEKNADTTAAIRRYQIRNGLQITGELNDETLRSLRSAPSASSQPAATRAPSRETDTSDLRDDSSRETATPGAKPVQPFLAPPRDRQSFPPNAGPLPPAGNGLFAGTPFENAPPDVQRDVIVKAQKRLARRGFFRNEIDGAYGPNLEFSLRAYQSRVGLSTTGRLDLETLAALELLPGAHMPVYTVPRRGLRERPELEPPVRGEWIRP
jgi:peptidoglycan hydrolase-like protein with peptidoglycan-binding domain